MKQLVFKKNQKINKKMIFVSKENLSHNYRQIDKFSGNSKVISVIKGDGYGHGLLECCKILKTNKCKDFYVARLDDAIKLRENFKNINIYLLSGVISNNDLKKNESSKQLNKLIDLNKNFNLPLSIDNSSGIFLGKQYHLNYVSCLLYTSDAADEV